MKSASVIILAAGASKRMGIPKFRLSMNDGSTFLEALVHKYLKLGCPEIVVVANSMNMADVTASVKPLSQKIKIALNPDEASEKLQSVFLGAQMLVRNAPVFLQPVDTPFLQFTTLQIMLEHLEDSNYVVPVFKTKGGHPVLISMPVLHTLLQTISRYHTLRDFLMNFDGKRIEVSDDMILANINTPADYKRVLLDALQVKINAHQSEKNIGYPGCKHG